MTCRCLSIKHYNLFKIVINILHREICYPLHKAAKLAVYNKSYRLPKIIHLLKRFKCLIVICQNLDVHLMTQYIIIKLLPFTKHFEPLIASKYKPISNRQSRNFTNQQQIIHLNNNIDYLKISRTVILSMFITQNSIIKANFLISLRKDIFHLKKGKKNRKLSYKKSFNSLKNC